MAEGKHLSTLHRLGKQDGHTHFQPVDRTGPGPGSTPLLDLGRHLVAGVTTTQDLDCLPVSPRSPKGPTFPPSHDYIYCLVIYA